MRSTNSASRLAAMPETCARECAAELRARSAPPSEIAQALVELLEGTFAGVEPPLTNIDLKSWCGIDVN
jgi:hypothetical protein